MDCSATTSATAAEADTALAIANPNATPVKPGTPVLSSPTHTNPATWVPTSTVTFNWSQPTNDPATILGYDWGLYRDQTTNPTPGTVSLTQTKTFVDVPDGIWTMHLWAESNTETFSDGATRTVRVDTHAPEVQINAPPVSGHNGWHNKPFSVALSANDNGPDGKTPGSGVQKIEYQLSNGGWLTYNTPLLFNTTIPTTTLWARATDQLGHVSEPISTVIKLDLIQPSSLDADGFRISYASPVTATAGNDWLTLGGQLRDNLSGRGHMMIADEAGQYHPSNATGLFSMPSDNVFTSTETALNWLYTPTYSVHGVYDIDGYAVDVAGNRESPNKLGTFSWYPDGQPDFAQTTVSVQPSPAYPGEVVNIMIAVRNSGTLESNVRLTETLPPGLTVLTDTIADGGQYLAASNAVVWDVKPMWPGETRYLNVSARVALTPTTPVTLQHWLALEPYWPDASGTISQPAATQQSSQIVIRPASTRASTPNVGQLAAAGTASSQTPLLNSVEIVQGDLVSDSDVSLHLTASPDALAALVREFTLNPATAEWELAQESAWMPFKNGSSFFNVSERGSELSGMLNWSLSSGDGVKYLAVYLAGANGRVSNPNISGLVYTNLVSPSGRTLNAGERVQFRVNLKKDKLAIWNLVVFSGKADLLAWRPRFGQAPEYPSLGTLAGSGFDIVVSAWTIEESGQHIVEVVAQEGPMSYRLAPAGDDAISRAAMSNPRGNDANLERVLADFDKLGHTPYERLLAGEGNLRAQAAAVPASPLTLTIPLSGILEALPTFVPSLTTFRVFVPVIGTNP